MPDSVMQEAIARVQAANEICKRYIFGGMAAGVPICRACGHPRKNHFNNPRGPQVSEREVLATEDLEGDYAMPWQMFAEAAGRVTHNLMRQVGYDHEIKMTIKKLPDEHPAAPGYEIVAKTRLP